MLVLSRRKSESVVIYDAANPEVFVEVQIVEIRGDRVRLGITAPRYMEVHRNEIHQLIQQEKRSGRSQGADLDAMSPAREPAAAA